MILYRIVCSFIMKISVEEMRTGHQINNLESPKIPDRGDVVTFWYNNEWLTCRVINIDYSLMKDNSLNEIRVHVSMD